MPAELRELNTSDLVSPSLLVYYCDYACGSVPAKQVHKVKQKRAGYVEVGPWRCRWPLIDSVLPVHVVLCTLYKDVARFEIQSIYPHCYARSRPYLTLLWIWFNLQARWVHYGVAVRNGIVHFEYEAKDIYDSRSVRFVFRCYWFKSARLSCQHAYDRENGMYCLYVPLCKVLLTWPSKGEFSVS